MLRNCLWRHTDVDLNDIVKKDEASNHEALASFNAIYPCVDVDGVSAEHSKQSHIHMIENTQIQHGSEDRSDEFWHHHVSYSVVCH